MSTGKNEQSSWQLALPMLEPSWTRVIPAQVTPSAFQAAIFDFVLHGPGDGLINAVAGAGKTWTLLQAARILGQLPGPRRRATFAAFNRHIANQLKLKLRGTPMTANTIHGIGYGCLVRHLGQEVQVDDTKYATLAREWMTRDGTLHHTFQKAAQRADLAGALTDLTRLARLTLTPARDTHALSALAARFDVALPETCLPGVAWMLDRGEALTADENVIDYGDLLWLPYRWQLQLPRVDYLFVDEAQDLSPAQLDLVLRCRADGGRMLFVGDPAQSIFASAGADTESFWRIKERTRATELPLSICYRCPRRHLDLARKLVPHIQARPDAPEGQLDHLPEENLAQYVGEGDLVLCRLTAPLITWCIRLVVAGIPARVRGVDVGANLVNIARRIGAEPGFAYAIFLDFLAVYETDQATFLAQRRNSTGRLQSLKDKCDALRACYESLPAHSLDDLCRETRKLFSDQKPPVWLSTVHRAKGLEHDTVFILWPHRLPLEWPDQQPWEWTQELNLHYVALTRARQRLVILQPTGLTVNYADDYINRKLAQKGRAAPYFEDIG